MTCLLFNKWSGNGGVKSEKKEKIKMGQNDDRILLRKKVIELEGVDFKKFVQSSKANKIRNNSRAVPKYPTLQGTKKVNNHNKNKFSEKKVRHTFVVEPQKKDLSKRKKLSLLEGKQAIKLEIKKYIKWSGVYQWTGLTLEERKDKLIEKIKALHSEERMIDDEFIYPRGIDYVQKVILFTHRRVQYLNLSCAEIKKEYAQMDLVWTLDWINRFSDIEELQHYFLNNFKSKSKEIALKDFLILSGKTVNEFYKIRTSSGDLYGIKKGKTRYLKYSECEYILKNYWQKSYSRILSVIIGELDISVLRKEYGFIKFEKKMINRTYNINDINATNNVVTLKSLNINSHQLSLLKKYIYKNHPLQKELVYDSSTKSYYFSKEGYEWFNKIYSVSNKTYQRIQKDLIWHKEYFRKRMVYFQNEYLDLSYQNVKDVWRLTELEYECYMSLGKFILTKDNLSYKYFEHLFVELELRHLVYKKNEIAKNENKKHLVKKRKTKYKQINDLPFFGSYEGIVVNYTTIKNVVEIYIETNDAEENLKFVKLKVDLSLIEHHERIMFMQFLKRGVSIWFEVSENQITGEMELESFTVRQVLCFKRTEKPDGSAAYKSDL